MLIKLNKIRMSRKGKVNDFRVWETTKETSPVLVNVLAISEVRPKLSGGKAMAGVIEVVWSTAGRTRTACVHGTLDEFQEHVREELLVFVGR